MVSRLQAEMKAAEVGRVRGELEAQAAVLAASKVEAAEVAEECRCEDAKHQCRVWTAAQKWNSHGLERVEQRIQSCIWCDLWAYRGSSMWESGRREEGMALLEIEGGSGRGRVTTGRSVECNLLHMVLPLFFLIFLSSSFGSSSTGFSCCSSSSEAPRGQ